MSYIATTKWGVCSNCGGNEQEVVKVKKELFCIQCRNGQKAEILIDKQKKRTAARNTGFKLRNNDIPGRGTEEYFMAERQSLIHDLDYVHSRVVRMMAADRITGLALCFTCGSLQHWTLCQLSHFIKRQNTITRWDMRANRCSCKHCNETLGGNLIIFAKKLNEEQSGLAEQLVEIAREPHKWTRDELKQELLSQRAKLKIIEQKFTNPIKQNQ